MSTRLPLRSLLQVLGLSVVALLLATGTSRAATAFDECDDQFAACQGKCGTSDWTVVRYDVYPIYNGLGQIIGYENVPVYDWVWTDHIDYFECQPGSGHGICQCSY